MSDRPVGLLIEDLWDSITKIQQYIAGLNQDSFFGDPKTIDAVVRNLEVIGEAAGRLPAEFTDSHPEVEWRKIVGLRNRIIHGYFNVDLAIIWQILQHDLPVFACSVSDIRGEFGSGSEQTTRG